MSMEKVAVIGGGTMGNGITQVFAMAGYHVNLVETSQELLDKALNKVNKNMGRLLRKEKISETQKNEALNRIAPMVSFAEALQDVEVMVEAVPEVFSIKKEVFEQADAYAPQETILATNTSSISITRLASATERPEHCIGMHFFNPVPVMPLVEVVSGLDTDAQVLQKVKEIAGHLGKKPVPVNDSPGFVSNRVLMPMINEAIFAVFEGVAEPRHIDQVMKQGMAHPMGPLRLADFIGLDVCLDILNVLYDSFKDPKYRPCPLLVKMVDAGKLGDKTGEGFFSH